MLIIEDDRATREALQRLFISRGWEVAIVTSQVEGLAMLGDYDADWVVVPWGLLEGTGEGFVRHVRDRLPRPRLALLTETEDRSSWRVASRLKPDAHFRKPLVPEEVFRVCSTAATRRATSGDPSIAAMSD